MGVIFDSCIWVALGSGQLSHDAVIAAAGEAPVYTSSVALGELRFGVEAAATPANVHGELPAPDRRRRCSGAAAFGVLAASVRGAGRSPRARYNDLWIAAQAIEHGYALMTLNDKDFAELPGLRLLRPR
ncbi:MAG: PIN domain-containing protein [Rhodanobacteraceae bacterium]|nr:PIN domain-containing protein [Rhodanobacteraceae bacterium]